MNLCYAYQTTARWTGRRREIADAGFPASPNEFSSPLDFNAEAGFWTPEHYLLSAVSACLLTTVFAIAEISKFVPQALAVLADGTIGKSEGGLRSTRIVLKPTLTVSVEDERERRLRLLQKRERSCLISRSLKCEVRLEPTIQVAVPAQAPAA